MRVSLRRFGTAAAIAAMLAAGAPAWAQSRGSAAALRPIAPEAAASTPRVSQGWTRR
jgi:hypothetical protein